MVETSQIEFKIANLDAQDYDELRVLLDQNSIEIEDQTHRGPAEAWQVIQATVNFLWEHKEQFGTAFGLAKAVYEWAKRYRSTHKQLPTPKQEEDRPRIIVARPGDLVGVDILNDDDDKVRKYLLEYSPNR